MFFVEEESPQSQIILSKPVELDPPVASDPRQAQVLIRLAEILGTAFQESAVLDFVLDELLKAAPRAERGLVLVYEEEGGELVPSSIRAPGGAPARVGYSRALMKQALARREGLVSSTPASEGKASGSDSLLMMGLRSVLCVPITFRNEIFGVVQLDGRPGSGPFTESELATALGFAAQIGMSIAYVRLHKSELKRELLDRDLTLARRVQQDFLPQRPPEVAGYGFAVEYTPAQAVGGDFFDFIQLSPTHVAVIAGDVSGKGVSAAIFGARVTSDFRYQSVGQTSPSIILERVNKSLTHVSRDAMFATAVVAVIDTANGQVEIATAAHPLGVLRSASGWSRMVGATGGPPIGIRDRADLPADLASAGARRYRALLQRRRHRSDQRRRRPVRQRAPARRDPPGQRLDPRDDAGAGRRRRRVLTGLRAARRHHHRRVRPLEVASARPGEGSNVTVVAILIAPGFAAGASESPRRHRHARVR